MNIVLVGYRCTGKSAAGKILAQELGKEFVDTDRLIEEKTGLLIRELVSLQGWDGFRHAERQAVKEVSKKNNLVIATGGGVVLNKDNVEDLKKNGFILWLKADAGVIRQRMETEKDLSRDRPSLTGVDPAEEIESVLEKRRPLYQRASNFNIDTSNLNLSEVTNIIKGCITSKKSGQGG